jgi:thiosulfate dehydrogenase [quinone] large subunit
MKTQKTIFLKLRFVMAFIFLWAFADKLLGLGFATTKAGAWINGGSPAKGFLLHGTKGPFVGLFHSLATLPGIDFLFMAALLFIGGTLLLNKYVKWGALVGVGLLLAMWLALLFPANNPIIDEHIVYALVLALLAYESKNGRLNVK